MLAFKFYLEMYTRLLEVVRERLGDISLCAEGKKNKSEILTAPMALYLIYVTRFCDIPADLHIYIYRERGSKVREKRERVRFKSSVY